MDDASALFGKFEKISATHDCKLKLNQNLIGGTERIFSEIIMAYGYELYTQQKKVSEILIK